MDRLRPFFSYFGSKWRLAPYYPVPEYDIIVEPFAGSAGYSLFYPDRKIYLLDKDPIVVAVWEYLLSVSGEEIMNLPEPVQGEYLSDYKIPEEAKWLMGFWIRQGAEYPSDKVTKFGEFNGSNARKNRINTCRTYKERVSWQVEYIRHWKIKEGDYHLLNNSNATWFIDPPYQVKGTFYKNGSKPINYSDLGVWSRERNGQVIVCENYGAEWLPFHPFRDMNGFTQSAGKVLISKEVIWTNS
jgi:site-specific DNA-adenine methylase